MIAPFKPEDEERDALPPRLELEQQLWRQRGLMTLVARFLTQSASDGEISQQAADDIAALIEHTSRETDIAYTADFRDKARGRKTA